METYTSAALPAMWAFVGVVFMFVGLRLYTRLHLLDSHGPDDYAYTLSSVSGPAGSCSGVSGISAPQADCLSCGDPLTRLHDLGHASHPYGVHAGLCQVWLRTEHGHAVG